MQDRDRPPDLLPREVHGLPRVCLNDAVDTPPKLVWPAMARYQLPTGREYNSLWGFFGCLHKEILWPHGAPV